MKIDLGKPTVWIIAGVVGIVWYLGREQPPIAGGGDSLLELGGGGGGAVAPSSASNPRVTPAQEPESNRQPGDPVDVPRPDPNLTDETVSNGGTFTYDNRLTTITGSYVVSSPFGSP